MKVISIYNMSIRPGTNMSNIPIGTLYAGSIGEGQQIATYPNGDKWIFITSGGTTQGWVAIQLVTTVTTTRVYCTEVIESPVQYGVIIRDYDMKWSTGITNTYPNGITHVSRPTRNGAQKKSNGDWILGLPATCRSEGDINVKLNENLQKFIHDRACKMGNLSPNDPIAKASFASFTRDNSYAFDSHQLSHDYINGTNEDAGDPQFIAMLTSGALVQIMGSQVVFGTNCWKIKAINVNKQDVWKFTIADNPELWYYPTISKRDIRKADGTWTREDLVVPFPQYNNKVIMWNLSTQDFLYIPKYRVQLINSLAERPAVYVG